MNKYTQHTPGPWIIDSEGSITDLSGRVIAPLVHGHNVPSLAFPRGSGQYQAEDDGGAANARLIAAAPDLLAALRGLIAAYGGDRDYSAEDNVNSYESAIALIDRIEGGAA